MKPIEETDTSVTEIAQKVVQSGGAPTVACDVWYRMADRWHRDTGVAEGTFRARNNDAAKTWVFDLASVTKPFFAMAVHTAITKGLLEEKTTLAELCPALAHTRAAQRTLYSLLSHRAGLVAHVELFRCLIARQAMQRMTLLQAAANSTVEPDVPVEGAHFPPLYSDLGYFLLGAAIEHHFEMPLDEWCASVAKQWWPRDLGSSRQWRMRADFSTATRFIPTEVVPWRGGLISGVVHDENAWLLSGHASSGHAGLFGTVAAVAEFGVMVLDSLAGRDSPIPRRAAELATAYYPDGTLCAGFDRRSSVGSAAGSFCSGETFGHLGFTGTSLWCDPLREIVVVVLTNRVCPTRENVTLRQLRPSIHDALFRWADCQRNGSAVR
jgi:CubicO group peptidase (beta-lactamase class C family)